MRTSKLAVIKFNGKPSEEPLLNRLKELFNNNSGQYNLFFMPGSRDPLDISPDTYDKLLYQLMKHFKQMGPLAMSQRILNITTYGDARLLAEPWPHHLTNPFQNNLYLLTPWPLDAETEDAIILSKRYGIDPRWAMRVTAENYLDIFLECNRLNIPFSLDLPVEGGTTVLKDLTERWMTDKRSRVSIFPIEIFMHRHLTAQQGQNQLPLVVFAVDDNGASEIVLPELQCEKCPWRSACSLEYLLLTNGHIFLCDNPGKRLLYLCQTVQEYYPFLHSLIGRINVREAAEYARLFF